MNKTKPHALIRELSPADAEALRPQLCALLVDAVDSGASLGFLPPLSVDTAKRFWDDAFEELGRGRRIIVVAEVDGAIVGAVHLALAMRENAAHRAEVQKLCVHSKWRGWGLGRELMEALEKKAVEKGRTLLVLDTRKGDASEALYTRIGYTRAGEIPHYARSASGQLHTTVFFYKSLAPRRA